MEYPKNVRYLKRLISRIGYVNVYSLCSTPFGILSGDAGKTFNIGGNGCMLILEFVSNAHDFRNKAFFLFHEAKEEFLSDMKEIINWFLDEKYQDLFFETEDGTDGPESPEYAVKELSPGKHRGFSDDKPI